MSEQAHAGATPRQKLTAAVEHAAHLLPAQGPISTFIHHNTLHAFESLPFEEAVVHAGGLLGCEPFLSEERYREEIARGRIRKGDVYAVLDAELGARGRESVGCVVGRLELRRRVALYGLPTARGEALSFLLSESATLRRFRADLPSDAREVIAAAGLDEEQEAHVVAGLFEETRRAVRRSQLSSVPARESVRRHRDLLLAASAIDVDEWVHPVLLRFVGAYLDQGLSHWPMASRPAGLFACFLELYDSPLARWCGPWSGQLRHVVTEERLARRSALDSLEHSLELLGVREREWPGFLGATALALRGWAGMVRQLEERPDRAPAMPLPARLTDFLAVRLLLERVALDHAVRKLALTCSLADMRSSLEQQALAPPPPSEAERAFSLFHAAQLCGIAASDVRRLTAAQIQELELELQAFDEIERRRVLHLAYERHLRHRFYDALVQHQAEPKRAEPLFQVMLCLDDREESLRRHLEEAEPLAETLGVAGFFGVAMYYRGATDARARPLCPVAIRPQVYVAERPEQESERQALSALSRRLRASFGQSVYLGSRSLVRGALLMTLLGVFSIIPLVLRVLFPGLSARIQGRHQRKPASEHGLSLERSDAPPPLGQHAGFTLDEMTAIVDGTLRTSGAARNLARLVLVLGHGSSSVNNPHTSAYDCGACGGGHGGPNARAFAAMANRADVRAKLKERGTTISQDTVFVGGEHDTTRDSVLLFDEAAIPDSHRALHEHVRRVLHGACQRNAHERSRRFAWSEAAGLMDAWAHVQGRALDLAQTRPEYNHATNAFCVVGRRERTRGLFLDRRAFLVSYDGADDPGQTLLSGLLEAVVPVVVGINLEYFFSTVDNTGYGCGSKLPHNVTALLGVMDGHQSDLRTGLWSQTVEIHEPVRLTLVVECERDVLASVLHASASIARLVQNGWLILACLSPYSNTLEEWRDGAFVAHAPEHPLPQVEGGSAAWYEGKHGHVGPARLHVPQEMGNAP
jgi:uncharacterized protein YbcC (UPF0753/DUF2309 family)